MTKSPPKPPLSKPARKPIAPQAVFAVYTAERKFNAEHVAAMLRALALPVIVSVSPVPYTRRFAVEVAFGIELSRDRYLWALVGVRNAMVGIVARGSDVQSVKESSE